MCSVKFFDYVLFQILAPVAKKPNPGLSSYDIFVLLWLQSVTAVS